MRKNKRYSYSGRFFEDNSYVSKHSIPKKMKSKFEEFRSTVGDDNSFRKKIRNAVNDYKEGSEKYVRVRLLIILALLIIILFLFFMI